MVNLIKDTKSFVQGRKKDHWGRSIFFKIITFSLWIELFLNTSKTLFLSWLLLDSAFLLSFLSLPHRYKGTLVFVINLAVASLYLASCILSLPLCIFQKYSKTTLLSSDFIFFPFCLNIYIWSTLRRNQYNKTFCTHSLVGTILNLSWLLSIIHTESDSSKRNLGNI